MASLHRGIRMLRAKSRLEEIKQTTDFHGNQCWGKQFVGGMTPSRDQITAYFLSLLLL